MNRFLSLLRLPAALAAALMFAGCGPKSDSTPKSPAAAYPGLATEAQPHLPTVKIWIGAEEMIAERAESAVEVQTGLMFRTNLAENEGMIFDLGAPQRASFWMMNTVLPLSAAYISPEGLVLETHDLQPHDTNAVYAASENVQFVLETRQGWFKRHNIAAGVTVSTERGKLLEVLGSSN